MTKREAVAIVAALDEIIEANERNERMSWKPRNDMVLVRIEKRDEVSGLAMPDIAVEGKRFVIEGVGPDVKGLEPGDEVLMLGAKNVTYFEVPGPGNLIVLKQEHVVLVREE